MPYYVIDERNCFFESMTKEEIVQAIADATGLVPADINVDDAVISQIRETNKGSGLKFWIGTQAEYNALDAIVPNTFYIFTDGNELEAIEEIAQEAAAAEVAGVNARVTVIDERTHMEEAGERYSVKFTNHDWLANGSFISFYLRAGVVYFYAGFIFPSDEEKMRSLARIVRLIKILNVGDLPERYRPSARVQFLLGNAWMPSEDAPGSDVQNNCGDCSFRINPDGSVCFGSLLNAFGVRGTEDAETSAINLAGRRFFYQGSYLPSGTYGG